MKTFKIILITLLLASCASTYNPSDRMLQYKKQYDPETGLINISHAFNKRNKNINLCQTPFTTDKNTWPVVSQQGYEVKAYRIGEHLGTVEIEGMKFNKFEKNYYTAQFNLKDVKTVRIRENKIGLNNIVACKPELGDKKILLYTSNSVYTTIVVSNAEFDRFLAAVAVLSPRARFIEGLGF